MFATSIKKLIRFAFLFATSIAYAQTSVDLKDTSGTVSATQAGSGDHAVILVHGRGGNSQSWFKDEYSSFGKKLSDSGLRVLSVNWSGNPGSEAEREINAALVYLQGTGAKSVSIAGYSAGGGATAMYARKKPDGTFNTVIQFSSVDDKPINLEQSKKIFAFNLRDSCCGEWQRRAASASKDPKEVFSFPGGGHPIPTLVSQKADLFDSIITVIKK